MLLALATTLPLLLLVGGALWQQQQAERRQAEAGLLARAHATALLLDRELLGAERMLRALAASPTLARGDLPGFWAEMRVAGQVYGALDVNLIDAGGVIRLGTSWPPEAA